VTDAAYHGWLERVRPLTVEVIAVVVALVLAHAVPAGADWIIAAVAWLATIAIAVRAARAPENLLGTIPAALFAVGMAVVLAIAALQLAHRPAAVWSLFQVPPPVPRAIAFALVIPNAVAAALIFQAWLQTRVALGGGRWLAAGVCAVVYAVADRDPFALLIAIAPAVTRAENGSLVACIGAYVLLGAVAAFFR